MVSFDKEYSNNEITVFWKPGKCRHSAKCFRGLPQVFNPANRPWITIEGAPTDDIITTVNNCPSGALSYMKNTPDKQDA
jgi:uncharacterized Fe-S cluster protein YjdI